MKLSVEQARNKNGPIEKYLIFDKDSGYYNVTALATFSMKRDAHSFVIWRSNQ